MRSNPVYYLAPSAVSITPNANGSANDLAVYIAKGTKIKVYSRGITALGYDADNTYQQWTLTGRNRRLVRNVPHTIYARISKNDKTAYLVFAPMVQVGGEWLETHSHLLPDAPWLSEAYVQEQKQIEVSRDYWYVKLGEISAISDGVRTVTFDTGILGTEQYNNEWQMQEDSLPFRVELANSQSSDVPYLGWGKKINLTARLIRGWETPAGDQVRYWTITRQTEPGTQDAAWNQRFDGVTSSGNAEDSRSAGFRGSGQITLFHDFQGVIPGSSGVDDFDQNVAATFVIAAHGVRIPDSTMAANADEDSSDSREIVILAEAPITILAESLERYELELSCAVCHYNPQTKVYTPSESSSISVSVKGTPQDGVSHTLTKEQLQAAGLNLSYASVEANGSVGSETQLQFNSSGKASLPVSSFKADHKSKRLKLYVGTGASAKELSSATVAFVANGDSITIDQDNTFLRYAKGTTCPPLNKSNSSWKTTLAELQLVQGDTYWTWSHTAYSDGNSVDVANPTYYGINGTSAEISQSAPRYANTKSSPVQPTASYSDPNVWFDSIAATSPQVGDYIWSLVVTTITNRDHNGNPTTSSINTYGVSRVGIDGNDAYSMHVAYADDVTTLYGNSPAQPTQTSEITGFSKTMKPTSKFMGICVKQQVSTTGMDDDPDNPLEYEWARFQGSEPFVADMDNEMDSVACDNEGKPIAEQTVSTKLSFYHGSEEQAFEITGIRRGTTSMSGSSGTWTATGLTVTLKTGGTLEFKYTANATITGKDVFTITLSCNGGSYGTVTRTQVFTVNGIKGGAIYRLVPSATVIRKSAAGAYSPSPISCSYNKFDVQKGQFVSPATNECSVTYIKDNDTSETSYTPGTNLTPGTAFSSKITFILKKDSKEVDRETINIIQDGVTRSGADTYRYAVNTSSDTPPPTAGSESGAAELNKWYSTRARVASLWTANRYLWVETTVHWSDNTTTVLYSTERNPSNIVIHSQTVQYCRRTKTEGQVSDPATLTYGNYPATLNQGDWLYSKTTVVYKTSAGEDAGTTVTYGVTTVAENGTGLAGITEHYMASNKKYGEDGAPTTPSGQNPTDWGTSPNPSNPAWNASNPYLWNYEKIDKVDQFGNHTYERTAASVVAIFTQDGKGIESITNYYKASTKNGSNASNSESRPSTDGTDGWTTTVQVPDAASPYLWNYEKIVWRKPDGTNETTYTDPHVIGHFGKDGTSPWVADLDNEMDSVACDNEGKPVSDQSVSTKLALYHGSTAETFSIASIKRNGTALSLGTTANGVRAVMGASDNTLTITYYTGTNGATITNKDVFLITISNTASGISRTLTFTVNGIKGGVRYNLVPSATAISKSAAGVCSPASLTCSYTKYDVQKGQFVTAGGCTIKYTVDGAADSTAAAYSSALTPVTTFQKNVTFLLYDSNNTVVDRETVNIVSDGLPGKGIKSTTELYQATNSSAARQAPTSDTGWDTDPNLSHLTNKWTETYKYLWNCEKIVYSNPDGTESTEYTVPRVIAIWTKNGAAGKGVESIVNYYAISSKSSGVTRTSGLNSGESWSTSVQTPTAEKPYLWNYEEINWTNPTDQTYTDPHVIGHFGKDGAAGAPGTPGGNTATVYLYKRGTNITATGFDSALKVYYKFSSKKLYSNAACTTEFTSSTSGGNGWSPTIPTGTDPLYVTAATAYNSDDVDGIFGSEFATPVMLAKNGEDGANGTNGTNGTNGLNTASVFLYIRSASTPNRPTGSLTYTFSTGVLSGNLAGWSQTIPSTDGNPCWVIQATAVSTTDTDTISFSEWSDRIKLVEDGEDGAAGAPGAPGGNTATVYLYKRGTNITATGFDGALRVYYKFSSKKLYSNAACTTEFTSSTSGGNGWSPTIPTGTDPLYVTAATAYNSDDVDGIFGSEFATPVMLAKNGEDGANGTNGTNGLNTASVFLYIRSASTPNRPTGTLTYTFSTGVLSGNLAGWSQTIPSTDGNPCWVIQATAVSTTDTDTISFSEWSDRIKLVEDGEDGAAGAQGPAGADGTSPWVAELDNEVDSIAIGDDGKAVTSQSAYTTPHLYHGSTEETLTVSSITRNGTPMTYSSITKGWSQGNVGVFKDQSSNTLTFSYITSASISGKDEYLITVTNGSVSRTLTFTINGIKGGVRYNLVPSATAISKSAAGVYSPTSLTCTYTKYDVQKGQLVTASGCTIKYIVDGAADSTATAYSSALTPGTTFQNNVTFLLYDSDNNIVDRETVNIVSDGTAGSPGGNTATVYLYKRGANITATGFDGALRVYYKFSSKKLYSNAACTTEFTSSTSGGNGWSPTIPTGTDPLYVTAATAYNSDDVDGIFGSEFATPVMLAKNGEDGANGTNGLNVASVFLYIRSASTPNRPTGTLTYTFATGVLSGNLAGWSQTIPSTDGNPCWVIQATAISTSDTDTISFSEWSDRHKLVEDGAQGDPGESPYIASLDTEIAILKVTGNGKPTSAQSFTVKPSLRHGETAETVSILGVTRNGTAMSGSSNSWTATGLTVSYDTSTGVITVAYTTAASVSNGKDLLGFTIAKVVSGTTVFSDVKILTVSAISSDKYELVPSVEQIVANRNGDSYDPATFTLQCGYRKTDAENNVSTVSNVTSSSKIDGIYNLYFRRHLRSGAWEDSNYYLYTTFRGSHASSSSSSSGGPGGDDPTLTSVPVAGFDKVEFILSKNTTAVVAAANVTGVAATKTVPVIANGSAGLAYYYLGEWKQTSSDDYIPNGTVIKTTDFERPFISYTYANTTSFYMFIGKTPITTTSARANPADSPTVWEPMSSQNKYIIAKAIFAKFAKFGAAVINGDWMMSQYGTLYESDGTAHEIDDETAITIDRVLYTCNNAYTTFYPQNPASNRSGVVNFCPTWCVDLFTGKTYQNDAVMKNGCMIGRFNIQNNNLHVGNDSNWGGGENSTSDTKITDISEGTVRLRSIQKTGNTLNSWTEVAIGEGSYSEGKGTGIYILKADRRGAGNYDYSPGLDIDVFGISGSTNYSTIGLRTRNGVSVFSGGQANFAKQNAISSDLQLSACDGGLIYVTHGITGGLNVILPTPTDIAKMYGFPGGTFAMEYSIVSGNGIITIKMASAYGSQSGFYLPNEVKLPTAGIRMQSRGNVRMMLVWDNTNYQAIILSSIGLS